MKKITEYVVKQTPTPNLYQSNELDIQLRSAEKIIDFGIWKYDVDKDIGFWSDKMFAIFTIQNSKAPTFENVYEMIHPEDQEHFKTLYDNALKDKTDYRVYYRIIDKNSNVKFLDQYCKVIVDESNNIINLIGTTVDISEKEYIQQDFNNYVKQTEKVSKVLDSGVWSIDVQTQKVLFYSPRLEYICGYQSIDFEPDQMTWRSIIHRDDLADYDERNRDLESGKVPSMEYRIIHKNDGVIWVREYVIPTYLGNGELVRLDGIITDLTEQRKVQQQLTYLASHDNLTALANRQLFNDKLNTLLMESKFTKTSFSIMYLGLDGFKRINDSLGHLAGDKLLIEASSRVKKCTSSQDFVARMGGDEFAIMIKDVNDVEGIIKNAKTMIDILEMPYKIDNHELYITASIGISMYPSDGVDVTTLLGKADRALYRAKEVGKSNYQLYMPSLDVETYKLYSLDQDLRKAINRDELIIYYQPKVETKTGLMVGGEALIRWNHPEWKLVSAGEFIPLAEENGLIFTITNWVFRTVCEQIKKWGKVGIKSVPISINISPRIFSKQDWAEQLLQIINETNMDPTLLELEITENILIDNEEAFLTSINKLKSYGIKLSLDDFGTGYSSLVYLKKFKVDTIKIDRYFIKDYLVDNDEPITRAIIRLAHELNMTVVAEGVETEEQRDFLSRHNCDQIQGYLFSRPIPSEQFSKFLINPIIQSVEQKSQETVENKRKGFWVDLSIPLIAQMTIVQFKGKSVKLGKTEVLVEDIGIVGLQFMSHVDLPVNPDILLEFNTEILGESANLTGHIVWREVIDEYFEYGIEFNSSEIEQKFNTKLLNNFAIQIRKNSRPPGCKFVDVEKFQYLATIKGD